MIYDPSKDEEWRLSWEVRSPKYVRPEDWWWCLAHNLSWACTLRFAAAQGWWDGAGYHRDEVQRKPPRPTLQGVTVGPPGPHGGSASLGVAVSGDADRQLRRAA